MQLCKYVTHACMESSNIAFSVYIINKTNVKKGDGKKEMDLGTSAFSDYAFQISRTLIFGKTRCLYRRTDLIEAIKTVFLWCAQRHTLSTKFYEFDVFLLVM